MRCELITLPGKAGVHHLYSSPQATTHQRGTSKPPTSFQMLTLSGGKTKMAPQTRSIAPTLTLVSGPRRGTPRPTTSTTRRTSKGAQTVLSSTAVLKNLAHPLRQLLTLSLRYLHTHGDHHPFVHPQHPTVVALSYTWPQSLGGAAVSGWPGLVAPMLSSIWIPDILIVPLSCE